MKVKGGANLVDRQPAFSADGKLLLVCTSCSVSVYSVATGLLVNQLEGHIAPVTSVNVVHYAGGARSVVNHVWTSSLDGTARFWDFTTGSLIKTVSVGRPIISMVIPGISKLGAASPSDQCIAFLLVRWDKDVDDNGFDSQQKDQNGDLNSKKKKKEKIPLKQLQDVDGVGLRVILHNLTKKKPVPGHLAKVETPQSLVCSPSGGRVGIVDCRKIWVWKVPNKVIENARSLKVTLLHHTKALQALAFDPTETVVAGSDDSGRTLIWKNVGEHTFNSAAPGLEEQMGHGQKNAGEFDMNRGVRGDDDAAALITHHWHSDEVNFLAFSVDGAYLFSGGKEAVFVMWQLETGKRRFLPRLGSSLLYCANSSDASVYSVSCGDNTIKLVNIGMMSVIKTIQGIKPPMSLPVRANTYNITRAAIEPEAGSLVFPGEDMSLQFYDAFYDRSIGEIAVTPHNYVSSSVKGKTGSGQAKVTKPMAFVSHVVFSGDSLVMATAECRLAEEEVGGGSCLKIWMRNSAKAEFCLNTQIDDPHSTYISSLAHHPFLKMAVSCCVAGEFKVWVQNESKKESENTQILPSWRCRSVGSYQYVFVYE